MKIQISNAAGIPNKYIRFVKWKTYNLKEKFDQLLYSEIYISKEGLNPIEYKSTIKLGVPGNDIVIKNASEDLGELWKSSFKDASRYLRKNKEKNQSFKTL